MTHVQNDVFALILHKLHNIIRIFEILSCIFGTLEELMLTVRLTGFGSVKRSLLSE